MFGVISRPGVGVGVGAEGPRESVLRAETRWIHKFRHFATKENYGGTSVRVFPAPRIVVK